MQRSLLIAVMVLYALAAPADKKKPGVLYSRPDQKIELATLPQVVARQPCANWAWAAGVEAMLRTQDVVLTQTYWVQRLNGGEICRESAGNFGDLAHALESDYYVLEDGRKLRLAAEFLPGPPLAMDGLIVALRANQPRMLVWRGHPYLIAGAVYDEQILANNARLFEVKEISLIDPLEPLGSKQRRVSFVRGRDDPREIDGLFNVRVVWL